MLQRRKPGMQTLEHVKNLRRKARKRYKEKLRKDVLEHYGNCCACCGETGEVFLTIDHINNNGAEHRRQIGSRKTQIVYRSIRMRGYPKDEYQLLCWNCNYGKSRNGGKMCPHHKKLTT